MDTMDTLSLFIEVFEREYKEFRVPLYRCRSALSIVNSKYSNFQDNQNRCTFMYKYAPSLFHLSKDCFTNLIDEYPPIKSIFSKCGGNICSLSCGPGLDYLAFMAALTECGHSLPDVKLKIIAASGAWRNTVVLLSDYLRAKPFVIKEKVTNLNYDDSVEVIQGNALKEISGKMTRVLKRSSLVLMVKTLDIYPESSIEKCQETANKLKDLISCLRPGAMIFCIDHQSNTEVFLKALKNFAGKFLQKPCDSSYKHRFSLILPESFKTDYGLYPVSSASGLCFLWQKSEAVPLPISKTCANKENMLNISCNINENSTTNQRKTTSMSATGKNISTINDKTYGWKNLTNTELNVGESLLGSKLNVPSTSSTSGNPAGSFSSSSMENLGCIKWKLQDVKLAAESLVSFLRSKKEDVTSLPLESRIEDVVAVTNPLETCMRDTDNIALALLLSKKDIADISLESSATDLTASTLELNMEDSSPQMCFGKVDEASLESSEENSDVDHSISIIEDAANPSLEAKLKKVAEVYLELSNDNSDVDPLISTMEDVANLSLEAKLEKAALISSPKVDKEITSKEESLNGSTSKNKMPVCQALENQLTYNINGLSGSSPSDNAQSNFAENKWENSGCRNEFSPLFSTNETCVSPNTKSTMENIKGLPLKLDNIETDKSFTPQSDSLHADEAFQTKSTQTDGSPTTCEDVFKKLTDRLTHLESLTEQLLKDCASSVKTHHSKCVPNVNINNCSNFTFINPASSHLCGISCPTKIDSHPTNGCHCPRGSSVPHCEQHINSNSNQNPTGPSIVIPLQNIDSIAQIIQGLRVTPTTY